MRRSSNSCAAHQRTNRVYKLNADLWALRRLLNFNRSLKLKKKLRDSVSSCSTIMKAISYLKWEPLEEEHHPLGCSNDDSRRGSNVFRLQSHLTATIFKEDYEKFKRFGFLWKLKGFENSSDEGLMEMTVKMNVCWETPGPFYRPFNGLESQRESQARSEQDTCPTRCLHSRDIHVQKLLERPLSPKPESRPNENHV